MRGLSLWQPWATAIALGLKQYETRGWSTKYRGPIAIHAARKWSAAMQADRNALVWDLLGIGDDCPGISELQAPPVLGAFVAVVDLVEVYPTDGCWFMDEISKREELLGNYANGRFAWKLENVKRLSRPVPYSAQRGLFVCNDMVQTLLRNAA